MRAFRVLVIAYFLVVVALAILFQQSYIFLALIFIFNVVVVYYIGAVAIRGLVFPYSVWIVQDILCGQNSSQYASDLASLLEKSYVIMRIQILKEKKQEAPNSNLNKSNNQGEHDDGTARFHQNFERV